MVLQSKKNIKGSFEVEIKRQKALMVEAFYKTRRPAGFEEAGVCLGG